MTYLLDSDVFIQAKNLHYGFDFCPAFWEWIDERYADGTVRSIEKVGDELIGGDDDLANWARQRRADFFVRPDALVLPSLRATSAWASAAGYEPAGVNIFLQAADYYLVAHAHAHDQTVVTHERPSTSTKKIKIPDACIGLGVKCATPFQMLRAEHARFVLGPAA
ncbi:MAG: DUF4411 family protein [Actinomycetota bacterium]|nr:DUF4411 family protein [Actinomycetota bacterium]